MKINDGRDRHMRAYGSWRHSDELGLKKPPLRIRPTLARAEPKWRRCAVYLKMLGAVLVCAHNVVDYVRLVV